MKRHREPELMDDPTLPRAEHERALRGLARLNFVGGAARMIWPEVRRELQSHGDLSVVDVACGGGDVLCDIVRRGRGRIRALGLDISETAVARAGRSAPRGVRFARLDVLRAPLPKADIVMCSLFLHHLDPAEVVALLGRMKSAARRTVIVSDLERSPAARWGVGMASRILTRSRVVHVDGDRSVRAAYTRSELLALAERAGLHGARVERRQPFRMLLIWSGN